MSGILGKGMLMEVGMLPSLKRMGGRESTRVYLPLAGPWATRAARPLASISWLSGTLITGLATMAVATRSEPSFL